MMKNHTIRSQQMIFQEIYEDIKEYRLENWRRDILAMVFQRLRISGNQVKKGLYLDIGCGAGHAVIEAAKKGIGSIGVDISRIGVRRAQRFAKHELVGRKNIPDFILGDAQYLPFRSNVFTKISSVQVIEHIPDDTRTIEEIGRVGKANCKVLVSTVNYLRRIAPPFWLVYYLREKRAGHLRGYKHEDLVKLCTERGFQLEDIIYYTHIIKVVQDLFRMIFPRLNWTNASALRKIDKLDFKFSRVQTGWTVSLLLKKIGE